MAEELPRKALPDRAHMRPETRPAIPQLGAGLNRRGGAQARAGSGARGERSGSSAPSAERRPPLHAAPLPSLLAGVRVPAVGLPGELCSAPLSASPRSSREDGRWEQKLFL